MMAEPNTINASARAARARAYLGAIEADLLRHLENAPLYGSCGLSVTFRDGVITSVDLSSQIKHQMPDQARRG